MNISQDMDVLIEDMQKIKDNISKVFVKVSKSEMYYKIFAFLTAVWSFGISLKFLTHAGHPYNVVVLDIFVDWLPLFFFSSILLLSSLYRFYKKLRGEI